MNKVAGRVLALILLFSLLAACGSPAVAAAASADAPDAAEPVTLNFELFHDYLIVVKGQAGSLRGLNFLVDTGATPSVLDSRLARKLDLATAPTDIAVLQGTARGATATIPEIRVGPVSRSNLPVLVEDISFVQRQIPVHLDGIIGLDVLGQSAFVIDYAARRIEFGSSHRIEMGDRDLGVSVPLSIDGGLALLNVVVDQRPAQLILDTGSPALILFRQRSASPDGNRDYVDSDSIGNQAGSVTQLASLTLGTKTIRHPSATFVSSRVDSGLEFAGLLSPVGLGITKIGIDVPRGQMTYFAGR